MTASPPPDPHRSRGPAGAWRRWTGVERATVLGTVFGFLALVVAVLTWQLPKQSDAPATGTTTAGPARATSTTGPPRASSPASGNGPDAAQVWLDASDVAAEKGIDRLAEIPRAVRGRSDYTSHAIAIRCPSNQTGDQVSDVTYLLRGRYVRFEATVHPYYPPGADQRSATYVTGMIGIRQRDGLLTTTVGGEQKRAGPEAPATLTAGVENAENLTLRVQCSDPNGTVVLTDARLTPA